MRIYKYELGLTEVYSISLPKGARPMYVGEQEGKLMLWGEAFEGGQG